MICFHCGKTIEEGAVCPHCGGVLLGRGVTQHGSDSQAQELSHEDETSSETAEEFYQKYKKANPYDWVKKIATALNLFVTACMLVLTCCILLSLFVIDMLPPEIVEFDFSELAYAEEFAHWICFVFLVGVVVIGALIFLRDALDWLSMLHLSAAFSANGVDGLSLLTQTRLADKKGKKEYGLISRALCSSSNARYKVVLGERLVAKAVQVAILLMLAYQLLSHCTSMLFSVEGEQETWMSMFLYGEVLPHVPFLVCAFAFSLLVAWIVYSITNGQEKRMYGEWMREESLRNKREGILLKIVPTLEAKCEFCGHLLQDGKPPFCPHCKSRNEYRRVYPLGWYYFLIRFWLYAEAFFELSDIALSVSLIVSGFYEKESTVGEATLLSGIASLVFAVLALWARVALDREQKRGPILLNALYIGRVMCVVAVATVAGFSDVFTASYVSSDIVASAIADTVVEAGVLCIYPLVMAIINNRYFKNRKNMFSYVPLI